MSSSTLPTPTLADRVRGDLLYLSESWPYLVELKIPGTARRWTDRSLGPLASMVSDDLAPGSPSPVQVSILDLLQQIATAADDMCRTVCEVLDQDAPDGARHEDGFVARRYRQMPSAWIDPREHLTLVAEWAVSADGVDDRTLPWLSSQVERLAVSASAQLGEARHGQVLAALCPWCGGRTSSTPVGGARTLVLRMPEEGEGIESALIVCSGRDCDPPSNSCGMRDGRGRPAWAWREWQWLSDQLAREDAA